MKEKESFIFTNNWFKSCENIWDQLFTSGYPKRYLEIGSFEGQSACYAISKLSINQVVCIDTWQGGVEHDNENMAAVEERFDKNIELALKQSASDIQFQKIKLSSTEGLATLISQGAQNYFDFIYIDGSHQAPDVLSDATLAFHLCRKGGILVFDDYLWSEDLESGVDPLRCPKAAIDAFTNIYCRKTKILMAPLYQLYVRKTEF